jgi:hypothetical protein
MRLLLGLLVSTLCASACALILDFDELGSGEGGAAAGSGGNPDGASATGGGGSSGATACATLCNDDDSCTDDACDETTNPPACTFTPKVGLVDDGFSTTLSADVMHRVTMVSGADAFYLAAFETTASANRTTLYRLALRGDTLESKIDLGNIGVLGAREVRSTAGLVADTSAGLQIHAFVAVESTTDASDTTQVWHAVIDGDDFRVTRATPLAGAYDAVSKRRYPAAIQLAPLDVRAAWVNVDGTISAGDLTFGDATHTATQLAPVSAGDQLGVLFAGREGVFVQMQGGAIQPVTQCETRTGAFTSMSSSWTQLPGFWFGLWTKLGVGYLSTEYKAVGCENSLCISSNACEPAQVREALRNPVVVTFKRPGDAPGVVYQAGAAPFLAPDAANAVPDAVLLVSLIRIDFGATPFEREPVVDDLGAVERARMPAQGALRDGPDFPAIAVLNDRVAIAWIQPGSGGRGELRVERLKMCLPP